MSIERILVPLDGSAFAERALPMAARIARSAGASLALVRVEEPILAPLGGLGEIVSPPILPDDATRRADAAYLDGVAARLRAPGTEVRTIVAQGDLARALGDACERERIDLVVMVSHARSGLARLLYGSAADRVVRHGPAVPVLVLHGDAAEREIEHDVEHEIERVAIALDEDADTEATVAAALDLARPTNAALLLVMARDRTRDRKATLLPTALLAPPAREADVALPDDAPDEREHLSRVAHALAAEGVSAEVRLVEGDDPASAIAQYVTEARADVVAVGASGRGGLADALRRVVEVPVLVVPGPSSPS